jgi:hypothetical protein
VLGRVLRAGAVAAAAAAAATGTLALFAGPGRGQAVLAQGGGPLPIIPEQPQPCRNSHTRR